MKLKIDLLKNSLFCAVLCLVMTLDRSVQSAEICEATINCLGNYDGDTITLPDNIVMLSKSFQHCAPTFFKEGFVPGNVDTISLFFVIDHSGSMSQTDPNSTRYDVTAKIIDSLRVKSGASEVGMAIFSNQLLHNSDVDIYAKRLDPASGWTDSYIPLTKLDGQVNGQNAVDYLKGVIALGTKKDAGGNTELVNGYYGKSGRHDGHAGLENVLSQYNGTTDISLAFDAARKAFQSARYTKGKQYIIFLSDGEPQFVDYERSAKINEFRDGTNLPTTFTAFWINTLQPIPSQITTMTENIKTNKYSETNEMSAVWKTNGGAGELISRLLNFTDGSGFAVIPSTPVQLTINGISAKSFDDSIAYFQEPILLNRGFTTLDISFTYHYAAPWDVDSTHDYKVVIKSQPGAKTPADITTNCWEQGHITFFVDNKEVTGAISDDDKTIEVRYYPPVEMPPGDVTITIQNRAGNDKISLITLNNGSYFYNTFKRENGPVKSDLILQNGDNDSIIAIYENPVIPLDVVREARRVGPARDLAPLRAWYLDQDADGYPDVIKVTQGKDRFAPVEVTTLKSQIYVTASDGSRSITVIDVINSDRGFDILLATPGNGSKRFTGVYTNELLHIRAVPSFTNGGSLAATAIAVEDSMAPVVVSGLFIPGDLSITGDDTLDVEFSESVPKLTHATPLRFLDVENSQTYLMNLTSLSVKGSKQKFLVTDIAGREAPGNSDSLWINELAGVGDLSGRIQSNEKNHRAPFSKIPNTYTFSVVVCPTPADPQNAIIPQIILEGLNDNTTNKGVVVMVSSTKPVAAQDTISGEISIYDQLGLPVVKDEKCLVSRARDQIVYIWDGTNESGRIVGDGIYVAVINVRVSTGVTKKMITKIGVLHDKK